MVTKSCVVAKEEERKGKGARLGKRRGACLFVFP
jgi:hypothetical protein